MLRVRRYGLWLGLAAYGESQDGWYERSSIGAPVAGSRQWRPFSLSECATQLQLRPARRVLHPELKHLSEEDEIEQDGDRPGGKVENSADRSSGQWLRDRVRQGR